MLGRLSPLPLYTGPVASAIQLLIVQPTPFCNIQCDYCYLPDRHSTARLQPATFRRLLERVFDSGLIAGHLSVVWHAGEPLALPLKHYAELFSEIDTLDRPHPPLRHSIQTNGMLLTPEWCHFIRDRDIRIGVSLDGPAFIHDRHRKDRQGRGTHGRVMHGIEVLRRHGIDFHVIAVITAASLDHADAIFDFFLDLGVTHLGFNVEELEGDHLRSSLMSEASEAHLRAFWQRLYERQEGCNGRLMIREFEKARRTIVEPFEWSDPDDAMRRSTQVAPLGIVSADWQGNLSSFSPELLGLKSVHYGDFAFSNVLAGELRDMTRSPRFQQVAAAIHAGVRACAESCEYFGLCGGGAPSNKYFENGSFDSTETAYCRASIKMPIDIVLASLERQLGVVTV